ncbi:neutral zinc metallopeptidase [Goodfellowiella coeruleoviolacea]|uniref:Metalloprotease n=1 Tax=Goodfellowiella coeruleoviolacea TaxID=334858 RepID=A0AAE3GF12_9PSEU|nr:neutral zinc metallopeptidase [Goodfellowiella coeruleoviolacea]MCP2167011.1 putative metalloprotease [Goodfellowiella coeruleoviolacea]
MRHGPKQLVKIALAAACLLVSASCTTTLAGQPSPATVVRPSGVDTGFVHGSDGSAVDRLAATAVVDVEQYWKETFPNTFGRQWTPLSGGVYSVDTSDARADPPPCTDSAVDVEGNAFYCPSADAIAWDRAALLPSLRDRYGDVAVVVVLAHEMGHAVQNRTGLTAEKEQRDPQRYPTILIEAMADCYAGAFVHWATEGKAAHLSISEDSLDTALGALVAFRDPVGTAQTDQSAHGNAFDRVSAFQDGYRQGPGLCSTMSVDNRRFTQQAFTSYEDQARGGNLPFDEMVQAVAEDLDGYFAALVGQGGGTWTTPTLAEATSATACAAEQGPVELCPDHRSIQVLPRGKLAQLHEALGDYATGTLLASRYGLGAVAALGRSTQGDQAGQAALCLAGAYTGAVLSRQEGFGLSPGDLDEAVQVLLANDYAARDADGNTNLDAGFDRVATFRSGVFDGASSCQLG